MLLDLSIRLHLCKTPCTLCFGGNWIYQLKMFNTFDIYKI